MLPRPAPATKGTNGCEEWLHRSGRQREVRLAHFLGVELMQLPLPEDALGLVAEKNRVPVERDAQFGLVAGPRLLSPRLAMMAATVTPLSFMSATIRSSMAVARCFGGRYVNVLRLEPTGTVGFRRSKRASFATNHRPAIAISDSDSAFRKRTLPGQSTSGRRTSPRGSSASVPEGRSPPRSLLQRYRISRRAAARWHYIAGISI